MDSQNLDHSKSTRSVWVSTIKQAFALNKRPLPWKRALYSGLCAGFPVLIGILVENLQYGLLASLGSFTYLYVFNIPYAQRAKKIGLVLLGIVLSAALGTLLAPSPIASVMVVGLIGAVATFLFGALRITGPAAIFFVMVFALSTGMPVDPSLAPLRAGLVGLGGSFAWLVGMIGWITKPHGPEAQAVQKVYQELGRFMDTLGTDESHDRRQRLVQALNAAGNTLAAGRTPWKISGRYEQLLILNERANTIFLYILEHMEERKENQLPPQFGEACQRIASFISRAMDSSCTTLNLSYDQEDAFSAGLQSLLVEISHIMSDSAPKPQPAILNRPSLRTILGGAFDKNSIVFLTAVRYGIVLSAAAFVAYSLDFNRSYWITLSCAAVLSGSTIIATFHRAIQRTIGTILGVLGAALILSTNPEGYVIVLLIAMLTAFTELAIVLNYGLAALFITPNALLIAESSSQIHAVGYFATARVIDVVIGCSIGLIGVLFIGRSHASALLPHFISKTLRSQQQLLFNLFSQPQRTSGSAHDIERRKMKTNLVNLNLVYTTAIGEVPSSKVSLEKLWPAMFSIEQLGYLLEAAAARPVNQPLLTDAALSELLLAFETMASAIEHERPFTKKPIPRLDGFPQIHKEIVHLQNALTILSHKAE
ncbi:hypothetical protein AMS62_12660 [Bacillus sp. FJAT-18019]|nr:hypothetical protein AMS62_12660 [Bacillus sp. FJAT-18019]